MPLALRRAQQARINKKMEAAFMKLGEAMARPLSMTPRAIREREAKDRARIEGRCLDCKEETSFRSDRADEWYMVHDALWLQAHPTGQGKLCIGCLERRLNRRLKSDDFTDAPVNEPGRGKSERLNSRLTRREPVANGI
jgi:hypothetical protein